jgi:hypothetical protein
MLKFSARFAQKFIAKGLKVPESVNQKEKGTGK